VAISYTLGVFGVGWSDSKYVPLAGVQSLTANLRTKIDALVLPRLHNPNSNSSKTRDSNRMTNNARCLHLSRGNRDRAAKAVRRTTTRLMAALKTSLLSRQLRDIACSALDRLGWRSSDKSCGTGRISMLS
jgi:hypothetical protein